MEYHYYSFTADVYAIRVKSLEKKFVYSGTIQTPNLAFPILEVEKKILKDFDSGQFGLGGDAKQFVPRIHMIHTVEISGGDFRGLAPSIITPLEAGQW